MPDLESTRRGLLAAGGAALLAGVAAACARSGAATGPHASTSVPSAGADRAAGGPGAAGPSASAAGPAAGPPAGPDITHGPRDGHGVALTFHGAGDPAITRQLLDLVAAAGGRITVLAIGQWLVADPALAKLILDGGHELGNHTWSHQSMPGLTAAQVWSEVDQAALELRRLTGSAGRWFRPSGTPTSTASIRAAAVQAGYGACLAYDVDPLDYTDPGADAIVRRFGAQVRPGSIVSLHLGHPETLLAMPRMLDLLRGRGLSAVSVSQLLAAP